jgi:GT2 family glycosyltransferase
MWSVLLTLCRTYNVAPERITSPHEAGELVLNELRPLILRQLSQVRPPTSAKLILKPLGRSLIEAQISDVHGFAEVAAGMASPELHLRLVERDGTTVIWRAKTYPRKEVFTATIPGHGLTTAYQLFVDAVQDNLVVPLYSVAIELPLQEPLVVTTPPFRADVIAWVEPSRHSFLRTVHGAVMNSGHLPWTSSSPQEPFRLGYIVRSEDQVHLEHRVDLPASGLNPGALFRFRFSLNTLDLPPGRVTLYLDAVKEQRFWFSKLGSVGALLSLDIPARGPESAPISDRLLHPPFPGTGTPSVCYIAPTLPLFDRSSGGRRLIELFRILRLNGVEVTFLYQQSGVDGSPERYLEQLHALGIEVAQDPLEFLDRSTDRTFSVCVLGWYQLAAELESAVRLLLPRTRIVVDSVDIHWVRDGRAKDLALLPSSDDEVAHRKAAEVRAYSNADETWVVSHADQSALAKELPWAKTRTIGIPFQYRPRKTPPRNAVMKILFVGGFTHPPNESAALWADQIVKEVRKRGIPIELILAGANPPPSVLALHDPVAQTQVLGYVESLEALYAEADLFIAPLRFGAGVKGKVLESIERGVPVLTNALGVEGLPVGRADGVLLAETTEEFVNEIVKASQEFKLLSLTDRARPAADKLEKVFGPAMTWRLMKALIEPPAVTIAIVTFNRVDLLRRCIDAVLTKTDYPNYRIAVVSNGCSDGTREFLEALKERCRRPIELILLETNDFFVRPSNRLIALFPNDDIVLMNNDLEVVNSGWLSNLVDAAYSAPDVGSAGGKILDPSGFISEAGAEIHASGHGRNLGRGAPADSHSARSFRDVGFVSGCLMYMRRDAILDVGSLDDDFHPMYFEDAAWHYRAHTLGWRTIYTPWTVAVHHEGSSAGTDVTTGMKRYQEVNRLKFLEKFRGINFERFNS